MYNRSKLDVKIGGGSDEEVKPKLEKKTFEYINDDAVNFSLLKASYSNASTAKTMGRRYIQTKLSSVMVNVVRECTQFIMSQIFMTNDTFYDIQSSIIIEIDNRLGDMIETYVDTMIQYMYDQEYLKILPEDKTLSLNSSMMIDEICSIFKVKIITMLKTSIEPDAILKHCFESVSEAVHGVLRDFFC